MLDFLMLVLFQLLPFIWGYNRLQYCMLVTLVTVYSGHNISDFR